MTEGRKPRYSVSAFAWLRHFEPRHLVLLPAAREMGYEGFEVPMFDPADLPTKALRDGLRANELACTVCVILPEGINPISPDTQTRKEAHRYLLTCVDTAAEIGATLLGGPILAPIGYFTGARPTEDEWTWAVEACHALSEALDRHDMLLSIELVNRSETFLVQRAEDVLRLLERVRHSRIGATLDTFHGNIEEPSLVGAVELLREHLFHVHLSENDRGILGRGHVPFSDLLKALDSVRYQGLLVVEGFGFDPGEPFAPGFLQADRATSPGKLARESLRYLKELVKT